MRWDEVVVGKYVRIMDATSKWFGINDIIVGVRVEGEGTKRIYLLVASKHGAFFEPAQLSGLPAQSPIGKLVYVMKPCGTYANSWNSDGMDRYRGAFHLVERRNGDAYMLRGVGGWAFLKQWLMLVRKTDGCLNNEYRNRCFVCNHNVVGRSRCGYCGAPYVPEDLIARCVM